MLNNILAFTDIALLWVLILIQAFIHFAEASENSKANLLKVSFVVIVIMGLITTAYAFL